MSDHREYISEVAARYTEAARETWADDDVRMDNIAYDVDVLTGAGGRWRVELLLAGGGPTAVVTVDSRYEAAEFFYSWGKDRGEMDCKTWELYGPDAEFWREVAEFFVDISGWDHR